MPDLETPPFEDRPPESDKVTSYDELHFVTYRRLLDAEAAGAEWREVVRVVFGLDPERSDCARGVHDSHLARARWIHDGISGFAQSRGRRRLRSGS